MRRTSLVAAIGTAGLAGIALAELLGIMPGFPNMAYNNTGVTTYDSTTLEFNVDASPLAIQFTDGGTPVIVDGADSLAIRILVNNDGTLAGGTPGNDLEIFGDVVTPNGPVSGLLLAGEITEFGFENLEPGTTDLFDMRFTLTGGLIEDPWFVGQDIGLVLTSEQSNFVDFTVDWNGEAKGGLGPIPHRDDCANAFPVDIPSLTPGTTDGAEFDAAPFCDTSNTGPGTWYTVVGTGNTITASLCTGDTNYDSKLSVYCGDCPDLQQSDCCFDNGSPGCDDQSCQDTVCAIDDFCCNSSWDSVCADLAADNCGDLCSSGLLCVVGNDDFCGLQSQVSWCSQLGVEYKILVHGFNQASGSFVLEMADDGVPCADPVDCLPPPADGACCFDDGSCFVITEQECIDQMGDYQGDGIPCFLSTREAQAFDRFPNLAIPDSLPGGTHDNLIISDEFIITDVNVQIDISHTWTGDLVVKLIHNGVDVTIIDRIMHPTLTWGCSANNFLGLILDDQGEAPIELQCQFNLGSPPNHMPQNPLSAFDGMNAQGQWSLYVIDYAAGDIGTLDGWSLILEGGDPICTQPTGACCFTDGSCLELEAADCDLQGGDFQGPFTVCIPNDCDQPNGACCFTDGSCLELTAADCMTQGGSFQGPFTVCDPNPCPPPPCDDPPTVECGITILGGEDCCENGDKPAILTMEFTGLGCAASNNDQDAFECTEFGVLPDDVYIISSDDQDPDDGGALVWFTGDVSVDDLYMIDAGNAGETKLKSNTYIHIFDVQGGTLLQTVKFHTSCSQPLVTGDVFGASVLIGCVPEAQAPAAQDPFTGSFGSGVNSSPFSAAGANTAFAQGDDDDDDNGMPADATVIIDFSAMSNCPGGVMVDAVIDIGCDVIPVMNGQVVSLNCNGDMMMGDDDDDDDNPFVGEICQFEFMGDVLWIDSAMAVLVVTATDDFGNTAECVLDICAVLSTGDGDDDDDDDAPVTLHPSSPFGGFGGSNNVFGLDN